MATSAPERPTASRLQPGRHAWDPALGPEQLSPAGQAVGERVPRGRSGVCGGAVSWEGERRGGWFWGSPALPPPGLAGGQLDPDLIEDGLSPSRRLDQGTWCFSSQQGQQWCLPGAWPPGAQVRAPCWRRLLALPCEQGCSDGRWGLGVGGRRGPGLAEVPGGEVGLGICHIAGPPPGMEKWGCLGCGKQFNSASEPHALDPTESRRCQLAVGDAVYSFCRWWTQGGLL